VLLQGVCDDKMLFVDVYAGEPGSIHDYTLYRKSDLYRGIQNREIVFYEDYHLVGDLAYRVMTKSWPVTAPGSQGVFRGRGRG
jgi:hypothetical protein